MSERRAVHILGTDYMLTKEELHALAGQVMSGLATFLDCGLCQKCGGKMNAKCFECDAKEMECVES